MIYIFNLTIKKIYYTKILLLIDFLNNLIKSKIFVVFKDEQISLVMFLYKKKMNF